MSILVRFVSNDMKESIMNRFLATTALVMLMGAAPALAQSPDTPARRRKSLRMQAPMQPESPSAIPSEPNMKAPDQSSEAKPILPDQSAKSLDKPLEQSAQFLNEQKADDILASTIIGKSAVNSQDEAIGDVNDLVTDRSGKILAALIGVGGFLGIGEKDVAVRFEDLKLARDENNNTKVVLNVSKERSRLRPTTRRWTSSPWWKARPRATEDHQDLLEPRGSSARKPGGLERSPGFVRSVGLLERDFVVELLVEGAAASTAKRARASEISAGSAGRLARLAAAALAAVEHGELRVEALQHHFGRVAVLAGLVLPFPRLQLALDVDLRALLQILLGHAAERLAEDDHAVPLGALLALAARLVAPAFARRHAQIDDGAAILRVTDFGIGSEVAYENDFVD